MLVVMVLVAACSGDSRRGGNTIGPKEYTG